MKNLEQTKYPLDYLHILRIPFGYNMIWHKCENTKDCEVICFMLTVSEIVVGFETFHFLRHRLTLKDFPLASLLLDNCLI